MGKLGKNRKFGQRLRERRRKKKKEEERRKTSTRAFATRAKNRSTFSDIPRFSYTFYADQICH